MNETKLPLTAPQNQREMLAAEIAYAALRTSRLASDDLRARAGLPPRNDGAPIGPIEQWKKIAEGARTAWLAAADEALSLVPQMRSAEQPEGMPLRGIPSACPCGHNLCEYEDCDCYNCLFLSYCRRSLKQAFREPQGDYTTVKDEVYAMLPVASAKTIGDRLDLAESIVDLVKRRFGIA